MDSTAAIPNFILYPFAKKTDEQGSHLVSKRDNSSTKTWNVTLGNSLNFLSFTQSKVSRIIRNMFFFPLNNVTARKHLEIEEKYAANFWHPHVPLDLNFPLQSRVREVFDVRNETVTLNVEGKELHVTYKIIQSKVQSATAYYNFLFVPGNHSTIHCNAAGIYPFLASFLELQEGNDTCAGRFIILTAYDIECTAPNREKKSFQPENLNEVGLILANTINHLHHTFGAISHLFAHSLGSILFAATLKHLPQEQIPRHLSLHCGPTSIHAISKTYVGGSLLFHLAEFSGWVIDIEQEIADFCKKNENHPCSLVISGVKRDHLFPGDVNLCVGKKIESLVEQGKVDLLQFDPPQQLVHKNAHHTLRTDWLNASYLVKGGNILQGEHLAKTLVRRSLFHNR